MKYSFRIFALLKRIFHILILSLASTFVGAQENDTLPYEIFKDRVVLFGDLGFDSAPFSLQDNYELGAKKVKYRNNLRAVLGLGLAYRWFSLRVGIALPGQILSEAKYGKTQYFDVGLKFNLKQTFCTLDLRSYHGYTIKDAYKWNDTLSESTPNDIRSGTRSANVSLNAWWFLSKQFSMKAMLGISGHFTGQSKTWYLKTSLNYFGVSNDYGQIIPNELSDTSDRSQASTIGAVDLGVVPGYAYGNRINNWQFSVFAGLGGVIQSKFYTTHGNTRSFLGIAPRVDFRIVGGYSKKNYFVLLATDFDVKSLRIQDLRYNQSYYNIKIIGGVRIATRRSRESEKS